MITINVHYKEIFDSVGLAILIIDKDGIIKYANKSYESLSKHNIEDLIGKKLSQIKPSARLPSVLESGKEINYAIREEPHYKSIVSCFPILKDNEIIGAISIGNELEELYRLNDELNNYKKQVSNLQNILENKNKAKYNLNDIIAEDFESKKTKEIIKKISKSDTTILITGESGVGKELYAQAIHNASNRSNNAFIAVNCASLQSNLLESELFGYEDASFTGAKRGGKMGLFEAANNGTIFLDEISELSFDLQAKLLRTLQENSVRRVGSYSEIPINIRIIAATNKNLIKLIENNLFREDLYYRIAVLPLEILPLRKRKGDILPIAHHYLRKYEDKLKRRIIITDEVKNLLYKYEWSGNIRELKNAIEYAINMMDDYTIRVNNLPKHIQKSFDSNFDFNFNDSLDYKIKTFKRKEIEKAIEYFGNTLEGKQKAAETLGISISTLYKNIK